MLFCKHNSAFTKPSPTEGENHVLTPSELALVKRFMLQGMLHVYFTFRLAALASSSSVAYDS